MSNRDNVQEVLHGLRILLVEDDPLICLDLESSLVELGAIVTAVSNVSSALEVVAGSIVDFAILDFELGIESSEPIARAARTREIPFLYLSGYSEHDARFGNWPGVLVLVKPLSAMAIARAIERVLGKRVEGPPAS
jgi:CheY-like chemotaxis protein